MILKLGPCRSSWIPNVSAYGIFEHLVPYVAHDIHRSYASSSRRLHILPCLWWRAQIYPSDKRPDVCRFCRCLEGRRRKVRHELEGGYAACVGHVRLLKHKLAEWWRGAGCRPSGAKILLTPKFLYYHAIRCSKSGNTESAEEREFTLGAGIQCG